jgi:hypothetical protein
VKWQAECLIMRRRLIDMFRLFEQVVYFERKRDGEVRQHYGTVIAIGELGTYHVSFDDMPPQMLSFRELIRAL